MQIRIFYPRFCLKVARQKFWSLTKSDNRRQYQRQKTLLHIYFNAHVRARVPILSCILTINTSTYYLSFRNCPHRINIISIDINICINIYSIYVTNILTLIIIYHSLDHTWKTVNLIHSYKIYIPICSRKCFN